jgi:hypothetical protein
MTTFRKRYSIPLAIAVGLVVAVSLTALPDSHSALAAESPVGLGKADSFAVLAGAEVTNTGPTVVSGDLGVNAGSSVKGFPPGTVINGKIHVTDALSGEAKLDLTKAYLDAANRTDTTPKRYGALDNLTLGSGVYSSPGNLTLGGTLVLNGDASSVFIFKAAKALIVDSTAQVAFTGGASACNVFWQVTSSATLNTGANFAGTIMADASVTAFTGAKITGRLLASTALVSMQSNTVTRPDCGTTPSQSPPPTATKLPAGPAKPISRRAGYTG